MSLRIVLVATIFVLLGVTSCLDRKKAEVDGSQPAEAGTPDLVVLSETGAADGAGTTTKLDVASTSPGIEVGAGDGPSPGIETTGVVDVLLPDVGIIPDLGSDASADTKVADLPAIVPIDAPADLPADLPADVPVIVPDAPGSCPTGQRPCTSGGATSCIDSSACCVSSDCAGTCQTCNASHACVAASNQDDPTGHCLGTCDATGACKSKKGQTCQTVAAGCTTATTCSPDGICCDTACSGLCLACDIPGYLGTCTPVASGGPHGNRGSCGTDATCAGSCAGHADGTCDYPVKNCGSGPACSGTNSVIPQATCSQGTCAIPSAQPCAGGGACVAGACKTTCATDADCQSTYFCSTATGTCHMRAVQIGVGAENSCAVSGDGSVYCWGRNNYGQLGVDPSTLSLSNIPVKIAGLGAAKSVAVGSDYACALLTSGNVYCWGVDWSGQLGNGSVPSSGGSATPLLVAGLPSGIAGISAGDSGACVYTTGGALWCWGDNIYSELGSGVTGNFSTVPVSVSLSSTTKLAVGSGIICAIASGSAWCWGDNYQGKAGSPTTTSTVTSPTGVLGLGSASNPQWISTGGYTGCAIVSGGAVDCWGWNSCCALGNSGVADSAATPSAVNVQGLSSGATSVSVGFLRACAILTDKSLACWGLERYGGLGNGVTGSDSFTCTPYTLSSLGSVSAVSGSGYTSCALRVNGSIACWGQGNMGQIGNGATTDATTPVDVTPW